MAGRSQPCALFLIHSLDLGTSLHFVCSKPGFGTLSVFPSKNQFFKWDAEFPKWLCAKQQMPMLLSDWLCSCQVLQTVCASFPSSLGVSAVTQKALNLPAAAPGAKGWSKGGNYWFGLCHGATFGTAAQFLALSLESLTLTGGHRSAGLTVREATGILQGQSGTKKPNLRAFPRYFYSLASLRNFAGSLISILKAKRLPSWQDYPETFPGSLNCEQRLLGRPMKETDRLSSVPPVRSRAFLAAVWGRTLSSDQRRANRALGV